MTLRYSGGVPDRNGFLPVSVPQIRTHSFCFVTAVQDVNRPYTTAVTGHIMLPWTVTLSSLYPPPTQGALHTRLMTLTSPSLPTDLWPVTKGPPMQNWKLRAKARLLFLFLIRSCPLLSESSL